MESQRNIFFNSIVEKIMRAKKYNCTVKKKMYESNENNINLFFNIKKMNRSEILYYSIRENEKKF